MKDIIQAVLLRQPSTLDEPTAARVAQVIADELTANWYGIQTGIGGPMEYERSAE